MATWVKALLIVGLVLALLCAGAVGLGVYLWRQHGRGFMESSERKHREGREYGERTDNQGCVDESVTRHRRAEGLGELIQVNIFLRACLDASAPSPGFCDGVPLQIEFIKSAQWTQGECQRHGLAQEQQCGQLFSQVQQFCATRTTNRP